MHFTFFLVASLAACATALPNRRPGEQASQNNGLPIGQVGNVGSYPNNPNNAATQTQLGQASTAPGALPLATATPNHSPVSAGNTTSTNQGATPNNSFNATLVPEFGIKAGQNPDGTGNCSGNGGKLIPCQCPPDRAAFIKKVGAAVAAGNSEGVPVKFPTDDSSKSKKARIETAIVVLQNLNGKGVGCPAAATTFLEQQKAA